MTNVLTAIADRNGRNYITPEDVTEALEDHEADRVRLDLLAILGGETSYGAEDRALCAFVAWKGREIETVLDSRR